MSVPILTLVVAIQAATPVAKATAPGFAIAGSKELIGVHPISMAAASTGHKVALGMEDNSIRIIDAATRMTLKTLTGHKTTVQAIAWSPDGRWIASGDEKAHVFIWDTKTWTRVKDLVGHTRPIQALDFNATSTQLITTGQDDVIKIWEMKSLSKEKISLPGAGANFYGGKFIGKTNDFAMATLQQGARLYTAQKTMRGWLTGHGGQGTLSVDFNGPATLGVTAGRDNNASLFDMKSMNRMGSFKGHQDWVVNVLFSPNGKWLATSSSDRTVKIWDVKAFKQVLDLEDQKGVGSPLAFTADGKYLLTVDLADNLVIHTLNPAQAGTTAPVKAPAKKTTKTKKKKKGG
jgi:WD40 repeat protein